MARRPTYSRYQQSELNKLHGNLYITAIGHDKTWFTMSELVTNSKNCGVIIKRFYVDSSTGKFVTYHPDVAAPFSHFSEAHNFHNKWGHMLIGNKRGAFKAIDDMFSKQATQHPVFLNHGKEENVTTSV
jgi:hypothetical protein